LESYHDKKYVIHNNKLWWNVLCSSILKSFYSREIWGDSQRFLIAKKDFDIKI